MSTIMLPVNIQVAKKPNIGKKKSQLFELISLLSLSVLIGVNVITKHAHVSNMALARYAACPF